MNTCAYYFLVLDIETSVLKDSHGIPAATWLSYGHCGLYDRDGYPRERCRFREWKQLYNWLMEIQQKFIGLRIICFVHNLSFEFDFLIKNISKPDKFLTNSSHGVISATLVDFPQIEFRCTYKLSGNSLAKIGDMVGLPKLDSDYRMILPSTAITDEEIRYCDRDCDIVAVYITSTLLKEFGSFYKIPYTKTGRVRKTYNLFYAEYAKSMKEQKRQIMWDLYPPEDCYQAMLDAFAGGICISNPMLTGVVCENLDSYDIKSSYPFVQLTELFPYTIRKHPSPSVTQLVEKFWIAKIKFTNIKSKYEWAWLSVSKMNDFDAMHSEFFNGKLLSAGFIIRTITNVDYEMILKTYTFDSVEVIEFYAMDSYGELPPPYIKTIEKFANEKFRLKNLVDSANPNDDNYIELNKDYMLAKGDFNSIYGMTVQKLVQTEYYIDENYQWHEKDSKYVCKEGKHLKRNFLFGVYTTAYARRNILNGILANCPNTLAYCDTDSMKFPHTDKPFIDTNTSVPDRYKDNKAIASLGRFGKEKSYEQFVTYGAKKYAYKYSGDPVIYLTVAGLPKYKPYDKNGNPISIEYKEHGEKKYLKHITDFKPGIIFSNCKLAKKYINNNTSFYSDDDGFNAYNFENINEDVQQFLSDNKISTNGGVALFPASYSLDITKMDYKICKRYQEVLEKWCKENGIHFQEFTTTM